MPTRCIVFYAESRFNKSAEFVGESGSRGNLTSSAAEIRERQELSAPSVRALKIFDIT